jgi:hypothetical protein
MKRLIELADAGGTVIFENKLPDDVPGLSRLQERRDQLQEAMAALQFAGPSTAVNVATVGNGRVMVGDLETALAAAGVLRETLVDHPGLGFLRRRIDGARHYFLANRGTTNVVGWTPLACPAGTPILMDPLTGDTDIGSARARPDGRSEVYLQLAAGASIVVRLAPQSKSPAAASAYAELAGSPMELQGEWRLQFLEGGPSLPPELQTHRLVSWTELGNEAAQAFAGTVRYSVRFDRPADAADGWWLDLGRVCQSARVRLNGQELGTLFTAPFRVPLGPLQPEQNRLEVDVTNVPANRIRDLDRRQAQWQVFHDINFVNLEYKKFDASNWPLTDSGLLGPVRLVPMRTKILPLAKPQAADGT